MKIALAQMSSSGILSDNLYKMERFVIEAAKQKADLVVFPEMAYLLSHSKDWQPHVAEFSTLVTTFSNWAKSFEIDLCPGSLREPVEGKPGRHYNTLIYIQKNGLVIANYRKLHLFKALLPDRVYDEGIYTEGGDKVVVAQRPWGRVGFAICFDLRFPELFRSLRAKGAQIFLLPSAFTVPTGIYHWFTLIQARAIENQCFLVAPAMVGQCGDGRMTYGHSTIVSPWGEILLDMKDKEGVECLEFDCSSIQKYQQQLDSWSSRRSDLFPID